METWDVVLLVVAGYVATFGLARLMTRRREHLFGQFRRRMEQGEAKPDAPPANTAKPDKHQAA